jgi:hypothetical protein
VCIPLVVVPVDGGVGKATKVWVYGMRAVAEEEMRLNFIFTGTYGYLIFLFPSL